MLVIRFFRTGRKNQPFFKIVVTQKTRPPRAGRFVEEVGFFNPLTKEKSTNKDRIKYWLSKGAKPSDTVHNLLVKEGIIEGRKIAKHKKKKIKKGAEGKTEEAPKGTPVTVATKEEKPAEAGPPAEVSPPAAANKPAETKSPEAEKPTEEKMGEKPSDPSPNLGVGFDK